MERGSDCRVGDEARKPMHGRRRRAWAPLLLLLAVGCGEPPPEPSTPAPPAELAARFDPSATGSIEGQLLWTGPLAEVRPFRSPPTPGQPPPRPPFRDFPNPHAPRVD